MFDIQRDTIKLDPDSLGIPPFKEYYNSATNKEVALKDIEYIVWVYKWDSPYKAYPEDQRKQKVKQDVYGDENHILDTSVEALSRRFKEFQETPGTRLLSASEHAAEGLIRTLNELSAEEVDIDTAIKITKILKDIGNIVKSLDLAQKQAKLETADQGTVKGGGKLGLYE
jgi:hypothetical protein